MNPDTQDLDYTEICRRATLQMAQAVQATSAHMYNWDAAAHVATVVAEYYSPQTTSRERRDELGVLYDLNEFPVALRHLLAGQIYIIRADDPEADMSDRARLAAMDSKTALRVPLVTHDTLIGFIELCDSRQAREWSEEDLRTCQTLASHAAVLVENAYLQKTQRRQSALLALIHEVTWRTSQSLNPDQMIQITLETIARLFECTTADVMLLDETGRVLVTRGAAGPYAALVPTTFRQSIEDGIVGYVVRTGRSYLSNNVYHDPYYLKLEGLPRGSELTVPIQRAGKTMGVLNIESKTLGAFSPADVTTMEILAGQLATALENARLYTQTRQRLNELALLHEIALAGATAGDVDTLLCQATRVIAANLYSDNFGFFLLDEATGLLRMHPSYHGVPAHVMQITVPLGQGIVGHVAASGTPLVVADTLADPRYIQLMRNIRSEMAAPLRAGGRILGVLNVESRQPAAYSEEDLRVLVTIAGQLSAAIERAQAQEHAARTAVRLSVLNEIGRKAATILDPLRLLRETAQALHQNLKYDYVLTALVDRASGTLLPVGYAGGRTPLQFTRPIALDRRHGVLAHVALDGQVLYLPDTSRDPRYVAALREVRSELCVPICPSPDQAIGLVDLQSRRPAAFTPDDIESLKTLADQLAIALTNARLYDETQRRLHELSGLYELSQAFRLITDPEQLYGEITGRLARLLGVEQCSLVLYDARTKTVAMQSPAYGLRPEQIALYRWTVQADSPAWMQQPGDILLSNDPQKDTQDNPRLSRNLAVELGERNLLSVPLRLGERYLGMVRVANKVEGPFTSDDVRLLTIFASQAAIAIENARLLAESRRRAERLAALQRIGIALAASQELQPMVEALYRELAPLFHAETVSVYILEAGRQRLHCEWVDHDVYQPPLELDLDSPSLGAYVVRTGQPLLIADLSQERATLPVSGIVTGDPSRSWLGVPLSWGEQVRGTITLQAYTPGRFDEQDLELLIQIAPQIILAIQSIYASRQTQHHLADLTAVQRASLRLSAAHDQAEVMYTLAESARTLTGATDARIFYYDMDYDRWTLVASSSHYRYKSELDATIWPEEIMAQVFHSGHPVMINEPPHHPLYAQVALQSGVKAAACIPIKRGDRTLAVLTLSCLEHIACFTEDKMHLLTMLTDQAALALENILLFEAEHQQRVLAETLREMAATVSASLNLEEVLNHILDQLRRVVEYDQASIGLITNGRLSIRARTGFYETTERLEWDLKDLPLAQQIVATAQPVVLADMQDASAYPAALLNSIGARTVRATMGVPIISRSQVIGILYLDSFQPGAFTLDHARQVQTFTTHAAIAITNAQLYQALSDRLPGPGSR